MERRLAAVLIADVVGYSRLSHIDEEGTRTRFQADLAGIIEPAIATHRGRLVKTMGDAVLVEFRSVVDALRCAVDIQQQKAIGITDLAAAQRLDFRIGINLGDIIVEGEDIQGEGVNIAHRLQALAQPGGIVVSGAAYDHLREKLPFGYASLGAQTVKNIADPVRGPIACCSSPQRLERPLVRRWHSPRGASESLPVRFSSFWGLDWPRHGGSPGRRQRQPPACRRPTAPRLSFCPSTI